MNITWLILAVFFGVFKNNFILASKYDLELQVNLKIGNETADEASIISSAATTSQSTVKTTPSKSTTQPTSTPTTRKTTTTTSKTTLEANSNNIRLRRQKLIESQLKVVLLKKSNSKGSSKPNLLSSSNSASSSSGADLTTPFVVPKLFKSTKSSGNETKSLFPQWKKFYGHQYGEKNDELDANSVFDKNMNEITLHNKRFASGKETYTRTIDGYAALKHEDLRLLRTGLDVTKLRFIQNNKKSKKINVNEATTKTEKVKTTVTPAKTTLKTTLNVPKSESTRNLPTITQKATTFAARRPKAATTTTTTRKTTKAPTTTTTRKTTKAPATTTTRKTTTPTTTTTRKTTKAPTTTTTRKTTTPTTTTTRKTTTPTTTTTRKITTTPKTTTKTQVDWTTSLYYPPVKDQGQCGSCWAFSSMAVLEYQLNQKSGGRFYDLSEQQVVDCNDSNGGCNGGLPNILFDDMINYNFGIMNETKYPYSSYKTGLSGTCKLALQEENFKVVSQIENTSGGVDGWGTASEDEIAKVVEKYGPIVAAISVPKTLFSYSSGIFTDCTSNNIEHAIVIVGYGEENGKKYWLIRNSWGASWGLKGHFKLARGTKSCGINLYYTAPDVQKN